MKRTLLLSFLLCLPIITNCQTDSVELLNGIKVAKERLEHFIEEKSGIADLTIAINKFMMIGHDTTFAYKEDTTEVLVKINYHHHTVGVKILIPDPLCPIESIIYERLICNCSTEVEVSYEAITRKRKRLFVLFVDRGEKSDIVARLRESAADSGESPESYLKRFYLDP